uniref:RNase H type-1 domain-containing protein n=1 Tax=Leersia perrieri TaxID=77586 RepID=A0A0D9X2X9_9ORYZ
MEWEIFRFEETAREKKGRKGKRKDELFIIRGDDFLNDFDVLFCWQAFNVQVTLDGHDGGQPISGLKLYDVPLGSADSLSIDASMKALQDSPKCPDAHDGGKQPIGVKGNTSNSNSDLIPNATCFKGLTNVSSPQWSFLLHPQIVQRAYRSMSTVTDVPLKIEIGDGLALTQQISSETALMEDKILNFKERYNKVIRPQLVSRGLIAPDDFNNMSTSFLHRQTYKITNHYPNYLSCFDESIADNRAEWEAFLEHLVRKRVYIIEDWYLTIASIMPLMYEHGLIRPEDGTHIDFFKGECDASYDSKTETASLSLIIWKGVDMFYIEVTKDVPCTSATEAEGFASFALLSKARELKILKLLLCSDCKPVCRILSGELSIGWMHEHCNLYLMLRSMRRHFMKLVCEWKPRELMVFADDLAKASKSDLASPVFLKKLLNKWSHHLKGGPVFRIERTPAANSKIKQCVVVWDSNTPREVYYEDGAFHIIFVRPEERENVKGIPELNALALQLLGVTEE